MGDSSTIVCESSEATSGEGLKLPDSSNVTEEVTTETDVSKETSIIESKKVDVSTIDKPRPAVNLQRFPLPRPRGMVPSPLRPIGVRDTAVRPLMRPGIPQRPIITRGRPILKPRMVSPEKLGDIYLDDSFPKSGEAMNDFGCVRSRPVLARPPMFRPRGLLDNPNSQSRKPLFDDGSLESNFDALDKAGRHSSVSGHSLRRPLNPPPGEPKGKAFQESFAMCDSSMGIRTVGITDESSFTCNDIHVEKNSAVTDNSKQHENADNSKFIRAPRPTAPRPNVLVRPFMTRPQGQRPPEPFRGLSQPPLRAARGLLGRPPQRMPSVYGNGFDSFANRSSAENTEVDSKNEFSLQRSTTEIENDMLWPRGSHNEPIRLRSPFESPRHRATTQERFQTAEADNSAVDFDFASFNELRPWMRNGMPVEQKPFIVPRIREPARLQRAPIRPLGPRDNMRPNFEAALHRGPARVPQFSGEEMYGISEMHDSLARPHMERPPYDSQRPLRGANPSYCPPSFESQPRPRMPLSLHDDHRFQKPERFEYCDSFGMPNEVQSHMPFSQPASYRRPMPPAAMDPQKASNMPPNRLPAPPMTDHIDRFRPPLPPAQTYSQTPMMPGSQYGQQMPPPPNANMMSAQPMDVSQNYPAPHPMRQYPPTQYGSSMAFDPSMSGNMPPPNFAGPPPSVASSAFAGRPDMSPAEYQSAVATQPFHHQQPQPPPGQQPYSAAGIGAAPQEPIDEKMIWVETPLNDGSGKCYYYNLKSRETTWDKPVGFKIMTQEEVNMMQSGPQPGSMVGSSVAPSTAVGESAPQHAALSQPSAMQTPASSTATSTSIIVEKPPEVIAWSVYQTPEGRNYYHNTATGQTVWEKPAVLAQWEASEKMAVDSHAENVKQLAAPIQTAVSSQKPVTAVSSTEAKTVAPVSKKKPVKRQESSSESSSEEQDENEEEEANEEEDEESEDEVESPKSKRRRLKREKKEQEKKNQEEKQKQEEEKSRQQKSRPISSTAIPGTPWCVVWTLDRRVFFFNPSQRVSVWETPEELKGRADVEKLLESPPEDVQAAISEKNVSKQDEPPAKKSKSSAEKKKSKSKSASTGATANATSSVVASSAKKDDSDSDIDGSAIQESRKKEGQFNGATASEKDEALTVKRHEEKKSSGVAVNESRSGNIIPMGPEAAKEAELRAARERATQPLNVRIAQFKQMLVEKQVSACSVWEKELHKIVFDQRYLLLTSRERKQAFEDFVMERADEEKKEKKSKGREKREMYRELLREASVSSKLTFADFSSKYGKDDRYKAIEKSRDRESLFLDYISDMKKREKESKYRMEDGKESSKSVEKEKLKSDFFELLKEQSLSKHAHYSDIKRKIDDDERYRAIDSSSRRKDWFREFVRRLE